MPRPDYDLILVGGGLANGLIAWRLAELHPALRLLLLERGPVLGGDHTWSFHQDDLTPQQHAWLAPLVSHRWPGYEVRFPERRRILHGGYASITSAHFDAKLCARLVGQVQLGNKVCSLSPQRVELADGSSLSAGAVIDGRGPRSSPHLALGYQKFLGREVRLAAPHGLDMPVLMDAGVAQREGYRFVYLLPFGPDRLLIEDTYYADGETLAPAALRAWIDDYAAQHGWRILEVLREEQGVLPIILSGDLEGFCREMGDQPCSGLAAGLFHATTGYSLPHAVRLTERIAALPRLDAASLAAETQATLRAEWRRQGFFRLLNRMLFLAGAPEDRWRVMQRFYGLPEALIRRFYAGRLHAGDKLRILTGKPPVPLVQALRAALTGDLHRQGS